MTISVKCLAADDRNIFCVLGRLYQLDPQGESLRYLRLCTGSVCSKAQHYRRHLTKLAAIILRDEVAK